MAREAVAVGLGSSVPLSVVVARVPSSPLLRSAFFAPCSSFGPVKDSHFARRYHHRPLYRKFCAQLSNAASSGLGTDLHDSVVKLQAGLLQRAVDAGYPLHFNDGALNWLAIAVPAVIWYLAATPGSLSGLLDYAYAPMHSNSNISFNPEEIQVGRQIGQGSFGIVYEGYIGRGIRKGTQKKELHVILKKVKPRSKGAAEMHNAEVHMNRRVQRTAPNACADFLGTTEVSPSQTRGRLSEGTWLVWKYEGDRTLAYYMKQNNFPENVAESVLGRSKVKGTTRKELDEQNVAVICKIATQILTCLRDLHKTGLVHRDVKPLNLILAEDSGTFKLVDLGAAVDLRSGYNYVPDETIIDPTYAAPEHHVMPTSTPQLPPDPLCCVVSPLVWLLNTPDRFDLFSAGLVILQMAVKPLRQDIGVQTFNAEFKRARYDLDTWRRRCRFNDEEFSILDADGAAGWELVKSMLQPRHDQGLFIWPSLGSSRPSAEAALRHRFLTGSFVKVPSLKNLELPSFSLPTLPGNLIPNFSFNTFPKLGGAGVRLDMNPGQVVSAISAVMPTAIAGALTVATGSLVYFALRDSAQKSYAVGQWAVGSVGTIGSICIASFVLFRLWTETKEAKESSSKMEAKLRGSEILSLVADIGATTEERAINDMQISQLQQVKESVKVAGLDEAAVEFSTVVETSNPVEFSAPAEKQSTINDTTLKNLLSSKPQTLRLKNSKTGLAEAVLTMELQLASLESSIAAGRLFAQQQRQQIIQMEKLLNQQPQEPATAAKESGK